MKRGCGRDIDDRPGEYLGFFVFLGIVADEEKLSELVAFPL